MSSESLTIISPQTYESMCSPLESGDLPTVVVNLEASFEPVRDVILDLREQVEDLCNQELGKITKQGQSQGREVCAIFTSHLLSS